jgi:hypothetical protein
MTMRKPLPLACCVALAVLVAGCANLPDLPWQSKPDTSATAPKVDRSPAVRRSTDPNHAVLSLHVKKYYPDACMFGFTLTNTLPYGIKDIAFRFTAYLRGDVPYNQITRNFSEVNPSDSLYREIVFNGITCDRIERIEVTDVGRCIMDDLSRFTAKQGDCLKRIEIAPSSQGLVIKK